MTSTYVSRAGEKLDFALQKFGLSVADKVCADLGCSTGGFTDCLLTHGAARVYSVDTGYGVLDWHLRRDNRVICLERTNALFVELPEPVDFISIDVGWTPQRLILPHALTLFKPAGGDIVSLFKPHYESHQAKLSPLQSEEVLASTLRDLDFPSLHLEQTLLSPIVGKKGGNTEYLLWFTVSPVLY